MCLLKISGIGHKRMFFLCCGLTCESLNGLLDQKTSGTLSTCASCLHLEWANYLSFCFGLTWIGNTAYLLSITVECGRVFLHSDHFSQLSTPQKLRQLEPSCDFFEVTLACEDVLLHCPLWSQTYQQEQDCYGEVQNLQGMGGTLWGSKPQQPLFLPHGRPVPREGGQRHYQLGVR